MLMTNRCMIMDDFTRTAAKTHPAAKPLWLGLGFSISIDGSGFQLIAACDRVTAAVSGTGSALLRLEQPGPL